MAICNLVRNPCFPVERSPFTEDAKSDDGIVDEMDLLHKTLCQNEGSFKETHKVDPGFSSASKVKDSTKTVFSKNKKCTLRTWTEEQIARVKEVTAEDVSKTRYFWSDFLKLHQKHFIGKNRKQIAELWTNQLNPSFKHGMLTENDKEIIRKSYLSKLEKVEFNKDRLSPTIYADISKELKLQNNQVRFFISYDYELQIRIDQRSQEIRPYLKEELARNNSATIKTPSNNVAKSQDELQGLEAASKTNDTAKKVFVIQKPFRSRSWTNEQIAFIQANVTKEKIESQKGFLPKFLGENQSRFKGKTVEQLRELWNRHLDPSFVCGSLTEYGKACIRDLYFEMLKNVNFVSENLPVGSVASISKKLKIQDLTVGKFIRSDKALKRMIADQNPNQKLYVKPG